MNIVDKNYFRCFVVFAIFLIPLQANSANQL